MNDLAEFLANAGAAVAGGAALGGALGFLAEGLARDLGLAEPDQFQWTESWAQLGAIAGIAALIYRAAGVH